MAEFKAGNEKKEVADQSLKAYQVFAGGNKDYLCKMSLPNIMYMPNLLHSMLAENVDNIY